MLKVKLLLRAKEDIKNAGWKKGEELEMENMIFSENSGFAYYPLDIKWEIIKMRIVEYNEIDIEK